MPDERGRTTQETLVKLVDHLTDVCGTAERACIGCPIDRPDNTDCRAWIMRLAAEAGPFEGEAVPCKGFEASGRPRRGCFCSVCGTWWAEAPEKCPNCKAAIS